MLKDMTLHDFKTYSETIVIITGWCLEQNRIQGETPTNVWVVTCFLTYYQGEESTLFSTNGFQKLNIYMVLTLILYTMYKTNPKWI